MASTQGMDNQAFELSEEGYQQKPNGVQNEAKVTIQQEKDPQRAFIEFEDLEAGPDNACMAAVDTFSERIGELYDENKDIIWKALKITLLVLYAIYFCYAIYHTAAVKEESIDWCSGFGFLVIITCLATGYQLWSIVISFILSTQNGQLCLTKVKQPYQSAKKKILEHRFGIPGIYLLVLVVFKIFLFIDTAGDRQRLVSGFGIYVLIGLGFLFSKRPGRVIWRHVFWGVSLQFIFGLIILRWPLGKAIFECLAYKVSTFLKYTNEGSEFVYGYLVSKRPFNLYALNSSGPAYEVAKEINEAHAMNFVFVFEVLSVIFFFSFFVSMLFYLGTLQWVVRKLGYLLQLTVGTTACESVSSAANIFLGQSEAPLLIKPYLPDMTNSEIHAVMTGGFATVAGGALAAYIAFGVSEVHLMSASVMSAPAALACAKLMYPETKKTRTSAKGLKIEMMEAVNLLDAASQGAITACFLVANITGTLVAVLAFITFLNSILTWAGLLVGVQKLTFEFLLGKFFYPLSFIMGVPLEDLERVGTLVGLKTFVNEFAAYDRLREFESEMQPRSIVIATYALCGFSNPASIGIQIACLSTMAPNRRSDIARVAFRAFLAGSVACFLTACVAGVLVID